MNNERKIAAVYIRVSTVTQSTIKEYIENQQGEYEENFKIMG